MDAIEAIKSRHSVRYFDAAKEVSEADVKEIISLAGLAPSWVDSQPWRAYVAMGAMAQKVHQRHLENVEAGKIANPDWETWHRDEWDPYPRENMARHNDQSAEYLNTPELLDLRRNILQKNLYYAPVIVYLTIPKHSNKWSIYDLGSFAENLMLAAKAKGIDSMPAYEIVKYPDSVKEMMGIPDDQALAMGIALGYAKDHYVNGYQAPHRELDDFLTIRDK